ncbi:hypothetical protein ACRRTK_007373 [Alexandromys fortis]
MPKERPQKSSQGHRMLKTLLTHGFFRPGRFSSRDCWGDDYLTQGKNKVLAPILPVPLNWAQWELGLCLQIHTASFSQRSCFRQWSVGNTETLNWSQCKE